MTTGLVVSFGTLVGLGLPSVQGSLLARADFAGLIYLAVIGKCHASLNLPPPWDSSVFSSAFSSCLSPSARPRVVTMILK